jgi:hypothetical protein
MFTSATLTHTVDTGDGRFRARLPVGSYAVTGLMRNGRASLDAEVAVAPDAVAEVTIVVHVR